MAPRVHLARTLTATPLARQHARLLREGRVRRPRAIPWTRFRRDAYPSPALALAENAWRGLALGEYTAVTAFSRLASALAENGAPLDLVAAAAGIPEDEIRHTDYALQMASLLAGQDVSLDIDRRALSPTHARRTSIEDLDVMMLELSTLSETLAAALLTACRDRAKDPVTRAAYAAIVSDEVHHLRLGWYYLLWREPQWSRAERQRVADRAGVAIVGVERQFSKGRDAPRGAQRATQALGVLDTRTQRSVVRRVMEDEVVPGLDALGLGASHAWRVRDRVGR
jgi:hypothetical protein